MLLRLVLLLHILVVLPGEGKEKKPKKEKTDYICPTCQSVSHLMVKIRKEKTQDGVNSTIDIVKDMIKNHKDVVCDEERLKFYADRVQPKLTTKKMKKHCESIIPDDPSYKSAQTLRDALIAKKARSDITKILCLESGRCAKLWEKAEEPWQKKTEL
eukprot:gnl/MRDRNA2_/MRDRNA2_60019_c0_seq1.p1 gnl/MRDRNA2_/MRDRNA2_60019_c0~~gnl/MRDRNA2_/MRDRNA2_60019_c0_seq1.p1  ORF type:complete len:157 (+),score=34.30 gnl/MRDRNA2_/MRDRNA2_60019_c0_seq1:71-541(+)